jgi:hypothetical protein
MLVNLSDDVDAIRKCIIQKNFLALFINKKQKKKHFYGMKEIRKNNYFIKLNSVIFLTVN